MITPPPPKSTEIILNLNQFTPPSVPKPLSSPTTPTLPMIDTVAEKKVTKVSSVTKRLQKKSSKRKKILLSKRTAGEHNTTKTIKTKKNRIQKEIHIVRKKKKISKIKKRIARKKIPKKYPKKNSKKRSALANALWGAGSSMHPAKQKRHASQRSIDRMITKLYGREFLSFTPSQKKFIRDHLQEIRRITQNTLTRNGYPDVAVRTGQQGVNIVTFYLDPHGNISKLRLKHRIGYEALDQNTLDVIRLAYMYYPRPKHKTKITFYVNYHLQ